MKLRCEIATPVALLLPIAIVLLVDTCLVSSAVVPPTSTLAHKSIRRQAEQEEQPISTSSQAPIESQSNNNQQVDSSSSNNNNNNNQQKPARLYPDLARPQVQPAGAFDAAPFGEQPPPGPNHHGHGPPTPFLPFGGGLQVPNLPIRLNADQQPAPFGRVLPVPRPTTAAERLQSQSFADGLGRRLMSMIGLNLTSAAAPPAAAATATANQELGDQQQQHVLHNTTVLQQLSRGVNSIYGGLSRMYNSTIQDQLDLLQKRYKHEIANSTNNARHEHLAAQVPQFFKQMAARLGEAQEQLNKVWHNIKTTNSSTRDASGAAETMIGTNQQPQSRNFMDSFLGEPMETQFIQPAGQFFSQQFGHVRDFWGAQVQPQVNAVHKQLAHVWRDLAASGALAPAESLISRVRNGNNNNLGGGGGSNETNLVVDGLLKEIESMSPEYSLISESSSKSDEETASDNNNNKTTTEQQQQQPKLSLQMQNGLINAQRELNKAWLGLTASLQNALGNVRQTLEPRPRFSPAFPQWPNQQQQQQSQAQPTTRQQQAAPAPDPAENGINGKIRDLSKLQHDADLVNEAIQQQQREAQQRQLMFNGMDRFKSLFNQNFDFGRGLDELPNRVGDTISRFGTVVGDLWHQVPERWDNFVSNMKPAQAPQLKAKLQMNSTSETPIQQ